MGRGTVEMIRSPASQREPLWQQAPRLPVIRRTITRTGERHLGLESVLTEAFRTIFIEAPERLVRGIARAD
jgi:hypothetical protein